MVPRSVPDWRDEQAYAPLLLADRSLLCWEWLRRVPAYRTDQGDPHAPPLKWGLVRFEDPDRGVPDARPMWSSEHHSAVLKCRCLPHGKAGDLIDLKDPRWSSISSGAVLHCCLTDGVRSIRLDINGARSGASKLCLDYQLHGFESLERPLAVLLRLRRFRRSSSIAPESVTPERRARQVLLLRAFDALSDHATQRDMAFELLGAPVETPGWRLDQPDVRARAQRLARSARAMAVGGYRALLS